MKYRVIVSPDLEVSVESFLSEGGKEIPEIVPITQAREKISGAIILLVNDLSNKDLEEVISQSRNEYDNLFFLIADAIDCREGLKPGGARRMVRVAQYLGPELNLSPSEQWILEHACVLRDIGKIEIPNEILLKKSVLSYEEWVMLKSHSKLGADLLGKLGIFPELVPVISAHHESYDGDGYPLGLEGEQIPFLARVLKVIDVYCAMTSYRIYRSSIATKEEAIEHIKEERGKHFDPKVVDAFLRANIVEKDEVVN